MTDERALWDARYAAADYLFGTAPNAYLVSQGPRLPTSGPVLAVGDGEGRNAVWLAQRGLDVTLVDISPVGLAKAERLAAARGVRLATVAADLTSWDWPQDRFVLAVEIFVHVPVGARETIHRGMAQALAPGGLALVEAFRRQGTRGAAVGPSERVLRYDRTALAADFAALDPLELLEGTVHLDEGGKHQGMAEVVRYLGRRPNL